jgi:hypothetical protein
VGLFSGLALAPVKLVTWTAEQILEVAEAELYDEQAIRAALVQINEDYDRGAIGEEQFLAAEDALMERLEAARTRNTR